MAEHSIRLRNAQKPECDEPSSGRLVALSAWRASSAVTKKAQGLWQGPCGRLYHASNQFTPADHASLAAWAGDISHGYDRLEVEQGMLEDGSWAGYALIYRLGQVWSTWGILRRGDHLEVWRCASGKTVGRYALMTFALLSLPCATDHHRPLSVSALDNSVDWPRRNANSVRVDVDGS